MKLTSPCLVPASLIFSLVLSTPIPLAVTPVYPAKGIRYRIGSFTRLSLLYKPFPLGTTPLSLPAITTTLTHALSDIDSLITTHPPLFSDAKFSPNLPGPAGGKFSYVDSDVMLEIRANDAGDEGVTLGMAKTCLEGIGRAAREKGFVREASVGVEMGFEGIWVQKGKIDFSKKRSSTEEMVDAVAVAVF